VKEKRWEKAKWKLGHSDLNFNIHDNLYQGHQEAGLEATCNMVFNVKSLVYSESQMSLMSSHITIVFLWQVQSQFQTCPRKRKTN